MQRPCLHYKSEKGRESGGGEARDHPFPQTSTPAHLHGTLSYDFWRKNETGDRPALPHAASSGPDQSGYSAFSAFGGVSGRNHRETCSGWIVSLTTVTSSAFKPSRSVDLQGDSDQKRDGPETHPTGSLLRCLVSSLTTLLYSATVFRALRSRDLAATCYELGI
jgi:hypothetical protein